MTTTHTEGLKPCPCCGKSHQVKAKPSTIFALDQFWCVWCYPCQIAVYANSKEKCIEAWNRRPSQPSEAAIEERNFCQRCGKRNGTEGHIHTCSLPAPILPNVATPAMIDAGVAFILGEHICQFPTPSDYIRDLYATMVRANSNDAAQPVKGE